MNIFMCPMFQVSSECLTHRLAFENLKIVEKTLGVNNEIKNDFV